MVEEVRSKPTNLQNDQNLQIRSLASKIKGLNDHLQALLQKKIRIDIEIRKTKRQITKLRQSKNFVLKTSVALEQSFAADPDHPFESFLRQLEEYQILQDLEQENERSSVLLKEFEGIESFLYPEG